jgi:hypothetical protein
VSGGACKALSCPRRLALTFRSHAKHVAYERFMWHYNVVIINKLSNLVAFAVSTPALGVDVLYLLS